MRCYVHSDEQSELVWALPCPDAPTTKTTKGVACTFGCFTVARPVLSAFVAVDFQAIYSEEAKPYFGAIRGALLDSIADLAVAEAPYVRARCKTSL